MSDSEIMTILVLFHFSGYKTLKNFYLGYVCKHLTRDFPNRVSYNRFVELQEKVVLPMAIYMKYKGLGKCTGVSFNHQW